MARRELDWLSLVVGLVIGSALAALLWHAHTPWRGAPPKMPPGPMVGPQVRPQPGPRLGELLRLVRTRETRVQSMLDGVIGGGRSHVRLAAVDWDDRGDVMRLKKLSMALTVDQTRVIIDPDTREIAEIDRPQQEIDNLASLAMQAAGLDVARGDQLTVFSMPFDRTQEIKARGTADQEERVGFWGKALVVVLVLGVVGAALRRGASGAIQGAAALAGAAFFGARVLGLGGTAMASSLALAAAVFLLVIGIASLAGSRTEPG